jgi:hypothetical protein
MIKPMDEMVIGSKDCHACHQAGQVMSDMFFCSNLTGPLKADNELTHFKYPVRSFFLKTP